jgi:hypothetical protein
MHRRPLLLLPLGLLLASCALLPKSDDAPATPEIAEGAPVLTATVDGGEIPPPDEAAPTIGEIAPPADEPTPNLPLEPAPADKPNFFVALWQKVFPPKADGPPAASTPNWIGTVKAVSERRDYVLVDSLNYQNPVPGAILTTVGVESETGSVRVSDDRDPPFFIADIVSGTPAPGDRLYSPAP